MLPVVLQLRSRIVTSVVVWFRCSKLVNECADLASVCSGIQRAWVMYAAEYADPLHVCSGPGSYVMGVMLRVVSVYLKVRR